MRDDLAKANAMASDFTRRAFDDQRKGLEGEGREALIEQTFDRTRLEFNASVRVFNERRAGERRSSRLAVAAWTYRANRSTHAGQLFDRQLIVGHTYWL